MTNRWQEAVRVTDGQACRRKEQCDDFARSVLQHWPQVIVDDGQDPVAMAEWDRMIYHLSVQGKATNQPDHRLIFLVEALVLCHAYCQF